MKLKLLGKVMLSTLAPIVVGIAVLIMIASSLTSQGLYHMADIQLLEFAKKQASEIDNIMKNVIALADSTDSTKNMEELSALANSLGKDRDASPEYKALQEEASADLEKLTEKFPEVAAIILIAKDGKTIAYSKDSIKHFDASYYDSVVTGFRGQMMVETRMSQSTGAMSAMVSTPVTADGSTEVADGVLLFVVDLSAVSKSTIQGITLMPTSNPFVINDKGIVLMDRGFPELIGEDSTAYDYGKIMLAQKTGIDTYDWEGVPKTAHFAQMPTTKWIVGIETDESDFYTTSNQISLYLALAGLVILLVVAFVVYVVIKKVVVVVSDSAEIASYVAEGNLTLKPLQESKINDALKRQDEFSTLGSALKTMIQNLAKMVQASEEKSREAQVAAESADRASQEAEKSAHEAEAKRQSILEAVVQLEDIVNNIASASSQLSSQIEISTHGAEEQSARMSETAAAMDEMNSTVLEVARNSGNSAEIADSTKVRALDGAHITQKCQDSMTQVKNESMTLRQNMSELANHAQSISAVMSVISDIADQTNLLALNAAIEAARAGEAGRGFAVVADEVRKLAEKTISSTTDVANVIAAIQQSTDVNVQQVDTAVARIEEATELTIEGGNALQVILEMAEESADGIRAIATASEEQSATSDEIARSIVTVTNIASSTVTAMNEAARVVNSLSDQANQLSRLVDNLKRS